MFMAKSNGFKYGIIGGTGIYTGMKNICDAREETINTPFGVVPYLTGKLYGVDVVFISRHGAKKKRLPHDVNYRAHIYALKALGVNRVLATTAVGIINTKEYQMGSFIIPREYIDLTKGIHTFYGGDLDDVVHADMSDPFCSDLCGRLARTARTNAVNVPILDNAVYACLSGPQFENPAEIRMLKVIGADVVGMTMVPELKLAREAGLCYAGAVIPTNLAAGMGEKLDHHENVKQVEKMLESAVILLEKTVMYDSKLAGAACKCFYEKVDLKDIGAHAEDVLRYVR